jgi:MOSC domain-containing protein YiiM
MGKIERIWIKRAHRGPMDPVAAGTLDAGKGLRGNANYAGRRHLTLIASERWAELQHLLGTQVDPAARRANVMISGIDLIESRGRVLRVGSCRLSIGGETRPCERMEEAQAGLRRVMEERWGGGAWAQVLDDGEIHVGDAVDWES